MKISDILSMSLGSLFKRKVRTILTVMGVVIGTTSIVVMLSLGLGMRSALMAELETMGGLRSVEVSTNSYYGMSDSKTEIKYLNDSAMNDFRKLDHVESVYPRLELNAIVKCGIYMADVQIIGLKHEEFIEKAQSLGQGYIPSENEGLKFVYGNIVITQFYNSKTNRNDYYETGKLPDIDFMKDPMFVIFDTDRYFEYKNPPEEGPAPIPPKKHLIETAGVIAGGPEDWSSDAYYVYCDIDALKAVLTKEFRGRVIPGQPKKKNGKPYRELYYSTVIVNADTMDNVTAVQDVINDMGYRTYANAEWIQSDMQFMNIVEAVLGGIGAISLFVAAIGITNTMMMSIYERTKEIGIMKVIGCRIRDIQMLFLTEAGFIGFIGGTVGIMLSYLISFILNKFISAADLIGGGEGAKLSVIPVWLSVISVAFAILIAMIAGFLPSIRAMKLSPLAAIRAE